MIRIQRWSPASCRCVIEQFVDYDDDGKPKGEPQFLLMNDVCDDHSHLVSREKRPDHDIKAQNVLDLIEQTKARNLKQVDDLIAKSKRKLEIEDLKKCRQIVLNHNEKITIEWQELVSFNHAFDSHIHDRVQSEQ